MCDRRRTSRLGAVAILAAVSLCACAGIPPSGVVHVGRSVPAPGGLGDIDVRVLPAAAQPGLSPSDVVHGFLRALVSPDGNYDIARTYLSRRAAASWRSGTGVTTYDDSSVEIFTTHAGGGARTLQLIAPRLGDIDAEGNFGPHGGSIQAAYGLVRQNGQWRIDHLDDGVLLSALDIQRAFRSALVYYFNRAGTRLVPEQVFLRPAPGVTTALVRALVGGPGEWLAPSVRSGFPPGTGLLGNVPVDPNGVAEVNLSSSVRQAPAPELKAMAAQLVWTLRQVSDVSVVRILSDGSPLSIPGVSTDQSVNSWQSVDPDPPAPTSIGVYSHGRRWRLIGSSGDMASASGISELALSADGGTIAGTIASGGLTSLVVGPRGGPLRTRVTARELRSPTFDATGTVYVVAVRSSGQAVLSVPRTGALRTVVTDSALTSRPVQSLALSHDGVRVAAIVGAAGHGRLLVGRVVVARGGPSDGQVRFEAFRDVLPGIRDARGVAWDGADQILATVADATGGRELVAVDVDGYATRTIPTPGLSGQPDDVAAAPGRPILLGSAGAVWRSESTGAWTRLGAGDQPVYPN